MNKASLESLRGAALVAAAITLALSTREASAQGGEHKRKYALLPSVDQRSTTSEPDVVICAWRTHDAMADMTPAELLNFCQLVVNHSQQRASNA